MIGSTNFLEVVGQGHAEQELESKGLSPSIGTLSQGAPATFTLDHIYRASAVQRKPRGYWPHVVVKWARQRKIKRTGWGRYRKVQGR